MKAAITALLIGLSLAQPLLAAELKIGFVNTERIFRDSALSQKAQKKLEKEFAVREQDIQKQVKQARDLQTYLEKETLTLPDPERAKKEREVANLNRDIQRAQRELREDLNQRKNEEFAGIHEKARGVILDIAKKEGFDLIVENAVYAGPRVDITDRVLKALER
ncbi:MAG: OmpH family outer membrane protein [Betaproteobacteria bacterium]|nr:OmpH family outer membrane protein [Betaproteobacteria bacterium]